MIEQLLSALGLDPSQLQTLVAGVEEIRARTERTERLVTEILRHVEEVRYGGNKT